MSVKTELNKANKALAKIGVKPIESATEGNINKAFGAVEAQQRKHYDLCDSAAAQIQLLEDAVYERKAEL